MRGIYNKNNIVEQFGNNPIDKTRLPRTPQHAGRYEKKEAFLTARLAVRRVETCRNGAAQPACAREANEAEASPPEPGTWQR